SNLTAFRTRRVHRQPCEVVVAMRAVVAAKPKVAPRNIEQTNERADRDQSESPVLKNPRPDGLDWKHHAVPAIGNKARVVGLWNTEPVCANGIDASVVQGRRRRVQAPSGPARTLDGCRLRRPPIGRRFAENRLDKRTGPRGSHFGPWAQTLI